MSSVSHGFLFSKPMLTISFVMVLTPPFFEIGQRVESMVSPVVRDVVVTEQEIEPRGLIVTMEFRKVRNCELVDVVWYNGAVLTIVQRAEDPEEGFRRRLTGEQARSRLLVRDIASLDNSRAVLFHRCHPLWVTQSAFYP